jgi:hypothetical protein
MTANVDIRSEKFINVSQGASTNPMNFYSTTNSVTHTSQLPSLQKNFSTYSFPHNSSYKNGQQTAPTKARTGFSKNCVPFVNYDKIVDESEIALNRFSEDAFVTSVSLQFKSPGESDLDKFGSEKFISAIANTGFTYGLHATDKGIGLDVL